MSDAVWISKAMTDSRLILRMMNDFYQVHQQQSIDGTDLLKHGLPVPANMCPKRIWPKSDRRDLNKVPDLFVSQGHYIVSERAADILRQFDLGGRALHPVSEGVFRKDNKTRIPGDYFSWIFGNVKAGFLEQSSPSARPMGGSTNRDWCTMPFVMGNDDMSVSSEVLGGPDVWLDPMLFQAIFLSGRLADALIDAGLRRAFRLYRCRVI